jgi:hypothetical protein
MLVDRIFLGSGSSVLKSELYAENHMQPKNSSQYQAENPAKRAEALDYLCIGIDTIRSIEKCYVAKQMQGDKKDHGKPGNGHYDLSADHVFDKRHVLVLVSAREDLPPAELSVNTGKIVCIIRRTVG